MLYYFAYGSNLHPVRLVERIASAALIGAAEAAGHQLAFHKRGADASGKCSVVATDRAADAVHGALYALAPADKTILDAIEGVGRGYDEGVIVVRHGGRDYDCFTYRARQTHIDDDLAPYHWYKELVVHGARHLRLPADYIAAIEAVGSKDDPDEKRRDEHEMLLHRMRRFSGLGA